MGDEQSPAEREAEIREVIDLTASMVTLCLTQRVGPSPDKVEWAGIERLLEIAYSKGYLIDMTASLVLTLSDTIVRLSKFSGEDPLQSWRSWCLEQQRQREEPA